MVNPAGPIMAGGFETIKASEAGVEYVLLFLPDKHNEELQAAGQNPVFYWVPNSMRVARKSNGDLRLSFLHFVGTQDGKTNVGVRPGETRETSGGVLSFAMTGQVPDGVLADAHKQIMERMAAGPARGRFWFVRPDAIAKRNTPADVRPVPIRSSTLRIMVTDQDGAAAGNPGDPFFVNAQGQGPGSLTPTAEHPFIVNMGTFAAAQVEQGLLSTQTPVAVHADMILPLWAPITRLKMTADWERCASSFKTKAQASYWFTNADFAGVWNSLRMDGAIKIDLEMDKTIPGADNQEAMITKYIDMLMSMWLEQAKQVIFQPLTEAADPAPPRQGGGLLRLFGWGFGAGVSVSYRHDRVEIANSFEFNLDQTYAQASTMGGAVDGVADIIAADPSQKSKYLRTLYLDNWDAKITTECFPVVAWPCEENNWVGDPVASVDVQIGYPDTAGDIQWHGQVFNPPQKPTEVTNADLNASGAPIGETTPAAPAASNVIVYASGSSNERFFSRHTRKAAEDVTNAPEGWKPDKVLVKRKIHFKELAAQDRDPYQNIVVEQEEVDLDGEGTLVSDLAVEVRADNAGALNVGPISIPVTLGDADIVEVEIRAKGQTAEGRERDTYRYRYVKADKDIPRYYGVYTGQPEWLPEYTYRVKVIKMGTVDEPGDSWRGPWRDGLGHGSLDVMFPRRKDADTEILGEV